MLMLYARSDGRTAGTTGPLKDPSVSPAANSPTLVHWTPDDAAVARDGWEALA